MSARIPGRLRGVASPGLRLGDINHGIEQAAESWARRHGLGDLRARADVNVLTDTLHVTLGCETLAPTTAQLAGLWEALTGRGRAQGMPGYAVWEATSRAIARDPNSTADQLAVAARLYPAEVAANPALPLLAMVEPLKLGHLVGGGR